MLCQTSNTVFALVYGKIDPGDLNQTFAMYQTGFSPAEGSTWLGLEAMYALTRQGEYRLTIVFNIYSGVKAVYDNFTVNGAVEGYSFTYGHFRADLSDYGDGFAASVVTGAGSLAGVPFSTYDKDPYGCAAQYGTGWWYDDKCGPVLIYAPASDRGWWPNSINTLVKFPTMSFKLELMEYY
ncbi:fibrinogen-like protein 1-like protein [Haliotis rubra]|uniref:fibrinogen-like protein 1-like protein n=1 Tax=Haliotis rubra TaxID=36100 RepID=UPI001EE5F88C|nr:fibrinogen-like protein 1-like protein [Haliotis rubra]